jgi:hypothetical protein
MSMSFDVWAVNPGQSDDDYFYGSASIAAAGSLSLSGNTIGRNGWGYQLSITSDGADSATVFTVTGLAVGNLDGQRTTEVLNGPSATVTYSSTYWSSVDSIVASSSSVGGVKIGFGGNLALPRTRIKSVYYVAGTSGNITFTSQKSNTVVLRLGTPSGNVTGLAFVPPDGILTTKSGMNDFCVVVASGVVDSTIFCG